MKDSRNTDESRELLGPQRTGKSAVESNQGKAGGKHFVTIPGISDKKPEEDKTGSKHFVMIPGISMEESDEERVPGWKRDQR